MAVEHISADGLYRFAKHIAGWYIPRAFIRKLGQKRRATLLIFVRTMVLRANDNNLRPKPRPKWLPKRYIYGRSS